MKYLKIGVILLAVLVIGACSSSNKSSKSEKKANTLVDVLTEFSISLNEDNYNEAIQYLTPDEKNRILETGSVTDEMKRRLKALRLHKLIKNPRIQLVNGKLSGIYNSLPNLRQRQVENPIQQEETPLPEKGMTAETPPEDSMEMTPETPAEEEPESPMEPNPVEDLNVGPGEENSEAAEERPSEPDPAENLNAEPNEEGSESAEETPEPSPGLSSTPEEEGQEDDTLE